MRDFARHADLATTQGCVHKIESEKVTTALGEALTGSPSVPLGYPFTPE